RLGDAPRTGREGWLDPWPGQFAFQTFDQSGFLSADVGTGPAVYEHVEMDFLAEDLTAEQSCLIRLVDGPLHGARRLAVFIANVNVSGAGARGVTGEDDAFEHLVRVFLHEDAVVEGAGLAFVGVDAEVDRAGVVLGQEGPLDAARKAGPPAATQPRRLDLLGHLGGGHFVEGFGQGAVSA